MIFVFILCLVYPMLPVSLDCLFLIALPVFPKMTIPSLCSWSETTYILTIFVSSLYHRLLLDLTMSNTHCHIRSRNCNLINIRSLIAPGFGMSRHNREQSKIEFLLDCMNCLLLASAWVNTRNY